MVRNETVSTISAELKAKIRRHDINASRVMMESLERKVARAEATEIDTRLEKLTPALDCIDIKAATRGIRKDRNRSNQFYHTK